MPCSFFDGGSVDCHSPLMARKELSTGSAGERGRGLFCWIVTGGAPAGGKRLRAGAAALAAPTVEADPSSFVQPVSLAQTGQGNEQNLCVEKRKSGPAGESVTDAEFEMGDVPGSSFRSGAGLPMNARSTKYIFDQNFGHEVLGV